jgi:SRSO17 transposase
VWDDVRPYVLEHLADSQAVLVLDEIGFLNKGTKSVGVQRSYTGSAGRIENCQIGVMLAYASPPGRTFIDRELSLPQRWAQDGDRRREAGGPGEATFATKPQLAQRRLARVLAAGVRVPWVTADEGYGSDPALRHWREEQRQPCVLAVRANERVWRSTGARIRQVTAAQVAAMIRRSDWQRWSVREGAKGPRRYDWALQPLGGPIAAGWGRWLLVQRRFGTPTELDYDVVCASGLTPLAERVRVAGSRWAIEEGMETAKGEVGLDHYEVRRWTGWYRQITLALLALAYLPVPRAHAAAAVQAKRGA